MGYLWYIYSKLENFKTARTKTLLTKHLLSPPVSWGHNSATNPQYYHGCSPCGTPWIRRFSAMLSCDLSLQFLPLSIFRLKRMWTWTFCQQQISANNFRAIWISWNVRWSLQTEIWLESQCDPKFYARIDDIHLYLDMFSRSQQLRIYIYTILYNIFRTKNMLWSISLICFCQETM